MQLIWWYSFLFLLLLQNQRRIDKEGENTVIYKDDEERKTLCALEKWKFGEPKRITLTERGRRWVSDGWEGWSEGLWEEHSSLTNYENNCCLWILVLTGVENEITHGFMWLCIILIFFFPTVVAVSVLCLKMPSDITQSTEKTGILDLVKWEKQVEWSYVWKIHIYCWDASNWHMLSYFCVEERH